MFWSVPRAALVYMQGTHTLCSAWCPGLGPSKCFQSKQEPGQKLADINQILRCMHSRSWKMRDGSTQTTHLQEKQTPGAESYIALPHNHFWGLLLRAMFEWSYWLRQTYAQLRFLYHLITNNLSLTVKIHMPMWISNLGFQWNCFPDLLFIHVTHRWLRI